MHRFSKNLGAIKNL